MTSLEIRPRGETSKPLLAAQARTAFASTPWLAVPLPLAVTGKFTAAGPVSHEVSHRPKTTPAPAAFRRSEAGCECVRGGLEPDATGH
jgi:hypothetical protein